MFICSRHFTLELTHRWNSSLVQYEPLGEERFAKIFSEPQKQFNDNPEAFLGPRALFSWDEQSVRELVKKHEGAVFWIALTTNLPGPDERTVGGRMTAKLPMNEAGIAAVRAALAAKPLDNELPILAEIEIGLE